MGQVVIIVSAVLLSDLSAAPYSDPASAAIAETCAQHGATISGVSATRDPEQPTMGYVTIVTGNDVVALADALRSLDGVQGVFVKPATELP